MAIISYKIFGSFRVKILVIIHFKKLTGHFGCICKEI